MEEAVTGEELANLLAEKDHPKAYIGFEPSGLAHTGWLITTGKVADLLRAGFEVTVLLADWHAYINDKLGGDLGRIRACGKYLEECFAAMGAAGDRLRFVYASEFVDKSDYWALVLKVAKASSLSRLKRAMTIMGRGEDEAELDSSKVIYPLMQVADIFHLDVDVALGGMDQRKAHMLAREVAERYGWRKPIALHTPLLESLSGGGRMDPAEAKMSKSRPESAIFIHDSPEEIAQKLQRAYCPREVAGNPVLSLCRHFLFRDGRRMTISRDKKYGGDLDIESYDLLLALYGEGRIHPMDLKNAVAREMAALLAPVREYFGKHPENTAFI